MLLKEEVMGKARQDRERVEAAAEDAGLWGFVTRKSWKTSLSDWCELRPKERNEPGSHIMAQRGSPRTLERRSWGTEGDLSLLSTFKA